MESVARPPHRRKHSSTMNGVSFKNLYDDVLLSNGGKRNLFEAHEYAEIFAGSSSIPELDIPGLDERAGPGEFRSSKLDYSSIFSGLRNDDVAVPYEELFNASAKKSKTRSYRTPTDARLPLPESGFLNSLGKKRSSNETSDQSIDGDKQKFNMSFSRTSQRNIDISNGKTRAAQLHAVSGFTYFVDGNQRGKTEDDRHAPSLKREVSRTWSFSAEVEAVKSKGGLGCDKSYRPEKLHNVNRDNLKSNFSQVPPPSSCSSDLSDNKTPSRSSASNLASKEDVCKKIAGKCSPPFSDEEFDENSVAAVSAAALKRAIDQAQESIRLAKMIMERKKEGYQDGSKARSRGCTEVLGKETKIDGGAYISKENNASEKYEVKDPIFTGIDGKVIPPVKDNDTLVEAGNTELKRVLENVEAAKEHGEAFARGVTLFASNCSQSDSLCIDEKVELKKLGENVEAAETQGECKTANLKSVKVGYNNSLMLSMSKLAYHLGGLITGKEWREITVHNTKEPDVGAELLERALNASQSMQKQEKSMEEAEQSQVTFDYLEGPESRVERVLSSSQRTCEQEKVVDKPCQKLRIIQGNGVTEERESDVDDKGKPEKKFQEHKEMLDVEHLTVLRAEFGNSLNGSCYLVGNEMLEQEEMKKISENVCERKENDLRQGKTYAEQNGKHPWFESTGKLNEVFEEGYNERELDVSSDVGEVEKKVDEICEPENDNKKENENRAYDGDEPELAGELEQNKAEERHMNMSESDAAKAIVKEGNNYEVLNIAAFCDAKGTDNTIRGAEISEENHNKCEFWEAAYENDINDAVDVNNSDASTNFNDDHTNDTGTVLSEAQEACSVGLNSKAEGYQKAVKSCKENDKNEEAEQLFDLGDNEVSGMDSLRRSASEEFLVENKLQNVFEGLCPRGRTEKVGIMDADPEEKLPEDEDAFKSTNEIPDVAQMYDAKINRLNLSEGHPSDRTPEINIADVRQMLEQASELDEGSVSTSCVENIDELSAHESEESVENTEDKNSNKEELEDELEMVSSGRKSGAEQSEGMHTQLHSKPKEIEKSMETERPVERGVDLEKNKEDLVGTSAREEKDAKAGVQNSLRNDDQQRIEAITREREREKDRLAVERAIREVRERALAEARERAERAAVERAAAEVRQRVVATAREKLGKAPGGKQLPDEASTKAKIRAERAAVERATAEARERALEKAISQKTYAEVRTQVDRYPSERFTGSSRNNGLKHSFSSSDLENGTNTESAQRRKARLERHQRIMERAAKALEEKNMRDLLAQKEQAERNRLAESLDADIKRWASGKERNLRALLSTLQYILGPDSGWQPISLTEIITSAAVKKAYRKATLYVHPDKLQQRGASIQQKYICEKVFDLLKAAWNRFISEER